VISRISRRIGHHIKTWSEVLRGNHLRGKARRCAKLHGGHLVWPATVKTCVPVRVDGLGSVILGDNVVCGYALAPRLGKGEILLQARQSEALIEIGNNTIISNNIAIISIKKVLIGSNCQIGDFVSIYDTDFHDTNPRLRNLSLGETQEVIIGSNVWLGSRVMVLKGVTIGDDTVVAAGAVVTRALPAGVVAGGVPAKIIRKL
jgi:maltose O-acetyltransferase